MVCKCSWWVWVMGVGCKHGQLTQVVDMVRLGWVNKYWIWQVNTGLGWAGYARLGQVSKGQVELGWVRSGQVRLLVYYLWVRLGQVRLFVYYPQIRLGQVTCLLPFYYWFTIILLLVYPYLTIGLFLSHYGSHSIAKWAL